MVSQVQGQFMVFDGFVEMDSDAKIVNNIEATIKTWSLSRCRAVSDHDL